jgi:S-adenosyl methyltransferase
VTAQKPAGIDVTTANVARIYDYFLGGKDNFAADRAAADKITEMMPLVPILAPTGFLIVVRDALIARVRDHDHGRRGCDSGRRRGHRAGLTSSIEISRTAGAACVNPSTAAGPAVTLARMWRRHVY